MPGALAQIAVATLLGIGGRPWLRAGRPAAGLVFGLALSVASTVVLLRVLQERRPARHRAGHIAVGWLVVEDLSMVLVLVLLPASPARSAATVAAAAHPALIAVAGLTVVQGRGLRRARCWWSGGRVIPWLLRYASPIPARASCSR